MSIVSKVLNAESSAAYGEGWRGSGGKDDITWTIPIRNPEQEVQFQECIDYARTQDWSVSQLSEVELSGPHTTYSISIPTKESK